MLASVRQATAVCICMNVCVRVYVSINPQCWLQDQHIAAPLLVCWRSKRLHVDVGEENTIHVRLLLTLLCLLGFEFVLGCEDVYISTYILGLTSNLSFFVVFGKRGRCIAQSLPWCSQYYLHLMLFPIFISIIAHIHHTKFRVCVNLFGN